jgi:hypothetical protein
VDPAVARAVAARSAWVREEAEAEVRSAWVPVRVAVARHWALEWAALEAAVGVPRWAWALAALEAVVTGPRWALAWAGVAAPRWALGEAAGWWGGEARWALAWDSPALAA